MSFICGAVLSLGGNYLYMHSKAQNDEEVAKTQVETLSSQNQLLKNKLLTLEGEYQEIFAQNSQQVHEISQLTQQIETWKEKAQTVKQSLEKEQIKTDKLAEQKKQAVEKKQQVIAQVQRDNKSKAAIIESSQALLQEQEKVNTETSQLSATQEKLTKRLAELKTECADFEKGTSWDAKSDSCSKLKAGEIQAEKIKQKIIQNNQIIERLEEKVKAL